MTHGAWPVVARASVKSTLFIRKSDAGNVDWLWLELPLKGSSARKDKGTQMAIRV